MSERDAIQYDMRLNHRARRINITVRRDGGIVVTKPRWASMRDVERFVDRSSAWIVRTRNRFASLPKVSRIESSKREYTRFKKAALDMVRGRLRDFNAHYHLRYAKTFIRNQKTRWGSCSRAGNLSFNYRIVFLPPHLADYLLIHELCHLKEMNHSRRFWDLVAQTIPDYVTRRKELRKLERTLLID